MSTDTTNPKERTMRIFKTIDDVREHAERNAASARVAQQRYYDALAMLHEGATPSQVGKRFGFQPAGKVRTREAAVMFGATARAYEDMAKALTEIVNDAGKAAQGSFAEQRDPHRPFKNSDKPDPFDGFPTKVQER